MRENLEDETTDIDAEQDGDVTPTPLSVVTPSTTQARVENDWAEPESIDMFESLAPPPPLKKLKQSPRLPPGTSASRSTWKDAATCSIHGASALKPNMNGMYTTIMAVARPPRRMRRLLSSSSFVSVLFPVMKLDSALASVAVCSYS